MASLEHTLCWKIAGFLRDTKNVSPCWVSIDRPILLLKKGFDGEKNLEPLIDSCLSTFLGMENDAFCHLLAKSGIVIFGAAGGNNGYSVPFNKWSSFFQQMSCICLIHH